MTVVVEARRLGKDELELDEVRARLLRRELDPRTGWSREYRGSLRERSCGSTRAT